LRTNKLKPRLLILTIPKQLLQLSLMRLVDGNQLNTVQPFKEKLMLLPNMKPEDSPMKLMKTNSMVLLMPNFLSRKKLLQDQEKPVPTPSLLKRPTEKLLFTCSMTTSTGDLTTSVDTFSHKRERFTGTTESKPLEPKSMKPMKP